MSTIIRIFAATLLVLMTACQSGSTSNLVGTGPIKLAPHVQDGFQEFLREGNGAWAFAVTPDGWHYSYVYCKGGGGCGGRPQAATRAVELCERRSKGRDCKIYAINGEVVWKHDAAPADLSTSASGAPVVPKRWLSAEPIQLFVSQQAGFQEYIQRFENSEKTETGAFAASQGTVAYAWQTFPGRNPRAAAESAIRRCNTNAGRKDCVLYALNSTPVSQRDFKD